MGRTRGALLRTSAVLAVAAAATAVVTAEDIKGKWYFGGNLGLLVTTDNIRSNAALIISPLGPDGAPFTGDKGEEVSCVSDPNRPTSSGVFCDPRPDELLARQTQLEQTWKIDGTIGYGLTSNFSIQLDTGYYKGDIKNFDIFTRARVPTSLDTGPNSSDPCLMVGQKDPCYLTTVKQTEVRQPITAGTVTQIPLMLSGIVRFRKDSNFNPYLGLGAGYLYNDLKQDAAVDELNDRLGKLHIISYTDEFGPAFGRTLSTDPNTGLPVTDNSGNVHFSHFATVSVDSGFQWQAVAGAEYFFNDRMSMLFDARYIFSNANEISILMGGEDQIDINAYSEDLYRKDGSLRIFTGLPVPPNPVIDPNASPVQYYTCKDSGGQIIFPPHDYDHDGHADDACFVPAPGVNPDSKQQVVVQGGNIRLSAFTFAVGIRFHF